MNNKLFQKIKEDTLKNLNEIKNKVNDYDSIENMLNSSAINIMSCPSEFGLEVFKPDTNILSCNDYGCRQCWNYAINKYKEANIE